MRQLMLFSFVLFFNLNTFAQSKTENSKPMEIQFADVYTVIMTKDLAACREFYTKWFGFQPVFESTWFLMLVSQGERPFTIAFMHENHPSTPPSLPSFTKKDGAFLTFQVEDSKAIYEQLEKAGMPMHYALKEEPWGQRRFSVIDPNGLFIDVVQQIEPQAGFWDKYMKN